MRTQKDYSYLSITREQKACVIRIRKGRNKDIVVTKNLNKDELDKAIDKLTTIRKELSSIAC